MNAFINWLIKLFSKNTPEILFKNNILAASNKLNSITPTVTNVKTRYALANATMYMKGMTDKDVRYTKEDVEEMFGFINEMIAQITSSALGTTSFRDGKLTTTSLSGTIDELTSLLVCYMIRNFATGEKIFKRAEAEKYLQGIKIRSSKEYLTNEREDSEKQLASMRNEEKILDNKIEELLAKIASGKYNETDVNAMDAECALLESDLEGLQGNILKVEKTIESIIHQLRDTEAYATMLHEIDKMKTILSQRPYSVQEFQELAEEYIKTVAIIDTEHDQIQATIDASNSVASPRKSSNRRAAARKQGEANRKANENKQLDDENFSADFDAKKNNN